jgi:hypothetical protein
MNMKNVDEMMATERQPTANPQPLLLRNCCGTCPGFHSTKTNPSRCDSCNCDIKVHTHLLVLLERRASRKPLRYGTISKHSKCDEKEEAKAKAKEEVENAAKLLSVLQDDTGAKVNKQHALNIACDYDDACGPPPPLRLLNVPHATKKRAADAQMAKRRRLLSDRIVSCRPLGDDLVAVLSDKVIDVDVEGERN